MDPASGMQLIYNISQDSVTLFLLQRLKKLGNFFKEVEIVKMLGT